MELFLPCLYSFMGCVGYCLVFNIRMRKRMLLLASLGGAVGWCVYLPVSYTHLTLPTTSRV